ncbi:discoidin domain-containing protein [Echinicola sp. 20G]|uniref:discoidin domain-containing protein n=1 Tax=Echinicola sp. 20G TaxID=2781961 RepID=UPI00190FEB83|nr:discoidin domain-containing protein [Echinicola sp. 20G]
MKKSMIKYIYGLLILGLATSCMEDDEVKLPDGPNNIQAEAGYGEVVFSWDFPQDPNVVFVKVAYQNSAGENKHQKFSQYAENAVIAGLEERAYDFEISLGDKSGNLSNSTIVSVTPNKPPHLFVAETVELIPDFGSVKVLWENVTEREVAVNISYTDVNGQPQTEVFNSSAVEGIGEISDVAVEEQSFVVYVANSEGARSEEVSMTLAPYEEEIFDKSDWEIVDFSSEEAVGEGSANGQAIFVLDGDVSTFWHSQWYGASPAFPHHFTIDMKEVKVVSRVELFRRQNNGTGMTKFRIEGSLDNESWEVLGEFDFDNQTNDGQRYRLPSNPEIRYIKMVATEGPNNYTHLGEFNVFGQ